jgi:carbonic anhydrase
MKTVEIVYRYGPGSPLARPRPVDSETARQRLQDGNRAFAALLDPAGDDNTAAQRIIHVDPRDMGMAPEAPSGPEQRPFAAVLGCSDARVPIELVFNEGPNDLFVIRVAGNSLGNEVLGSLRYAVEHLGGSLKIIAVVGHSNCGAVAAAVDVFLTPNRYLMLTSRSLRNILDPLLIVVRASAKRLREIHGPDVARRAGYRRALVETSVITNAALAAHDVQKELDRHEVGDIRAVYGVYRLESRQVWAPHRGRSQWTGLADPPDDLASFVEFGNAIVHSDQITSILGAD